MTRKAKDPFLAAVARNIWMELAKKDIQGVYRHIPGKINLLSRWKSSTAQLDRVQMLRDNPMWLHTSMFLLDLDNDIVFLV